MRSGTVEGSRFYPDPVYTHILETPRLLVGRIQASGSRERLPTHLQPTAIRFVSYQCHTIRPNRILGRFREPPARQRLKNATLVCAISSGYGQPFKSGSPPGVATRSDSSRGRGKAALSGSC